MGIFQVVRREFNMIKTIQYSRSSWLARSARHFLVIGLCASVLPVWAGSRIELSVTLDQSNQQHVLFVQDKFVKVVDQSGQTDVDLIFDAQKTHLFVLNHSEKTLMTITQEQVDQAESLLKNVGEFAESQGAVFGELMASFGLPQAPKKATNVEVKPLEQWQTIAGYQCQQIEVYEQNELETQLCLASSLPLQANEQASALSFLHFAQRLTQMTGSTLSSLGLAIPVLPETQLQGFPLQLYSKKNALTSEVLKLEEIEIPSNSFELPPTYSAVSLPF